MAQKIHELLAVKDSLVAQGETCRTDLINNLFAKKQHHFTERLVTFKPLDENQKDKVEEQLSLQTTVPKELEWISAKLAAAMDIAHAIEVGNTQAKADVVLEDGTVLLKDVPTCTLLQLEKRMDEVRQLATAIPTLDPAKGFKPDADRGEGVYKAVEVEKPRTEKKFDFVVMVNPTDKHPAQVKELMRDVPIGHVLQQEWSSMITVAEKGDILDRIETLTRAIKKARSRANEHQVDQSTNRIGDKLLKFAFYGKTK